MERHGHMFSSKYYEYLTGKAASFRKHVFEIRRTYAYYVDKRETGMSNRVNIMNK